MFALLQDGKVPVSAEMVAERAGVSVASVFRYFDGLDDLQYRTFERFRDRFAPALALSVDPDTTRPDRIRSFVAARLDLYDRAGAIMAVGRLRSLEHQPLVEASAQMRSLLAAQVRRVFEREVAGASPTRASDLVAVIDALTSLEAWDVMRRTHARSRAQISHTWEQGIAALVDAWVGQGGP
jgi:AcrR family transcriptional regulator